MMKIVPVIIANMIRRYNGKKVKRYIPT